MKITLRSEVEVSVSILQSQVEINFSDLTNTFSHIL